MKFNRLLFVIVIIMSSLLVHSQKVKFRLEVGNSINFSSYKPKLFMTDYQELIPTSEYTYKKMARNGILGIPTSIGLAIEFDYKKKNHFTFSYMLLDIISVKDRTIFNYAIYQDSSGTNYAAPWSSTDDSEIGIYKIGFKYSRDIGDGWFRISPLIGISYAWFGDGASPGQLNGFSLKAYEDDLMFMNSNYSIATVDNFANHVSTFMGSIGMNFRFHSKKRELFAIKVFYEQGFRAIYQKQTTVYRNGNMFAENMMYSYGSALYVKLSIPIPVYNFVDHKWGK